MFKNLSTSLIVRGVAAIALGIIAIVWPDITVGAFVFVFAVFAFADAFGQGARAFSSDSAGPVFGHLLLALIDIAAGVVAIAWPGITAYALVIWVGIWAVVSGLVEGQADLHHTGHDGPDADPDHQGIGGDPGPRDGDDPGRDVDQREEQMTEDGPGGVA